MKAVRKFFNRYLSPQKKKVKYLRELMGFTPANLSVYLLAFKHSSKSADAHTSNERLEFLGDAVLDTVISEYLFMTYPIRGEGFLTEMRSKIVNRKRLGEIGHQLKLERFLDYHKGFVTLNSTILGNALEALIGAIYLDAGFHKAKIFIITKILSPYINLDDLQNLDINYKSRLFEWSQRFEKELTFEVLEEKNTNKVRIFVVGAFIDGELMGSGEARNKKDAEKEASREVYQKLNVEASMEW
ncbi:ribonuclease III [Sphingobacteriales bacterium UPWRP_1]|nr:ribonuclease III [Sphingobacteriales bacterium TSM_CSS]PSJ71516.1 ribonuclease III [Sphingobacteriales bacterium UPWRP_1]